MSAGNPGQKVYVYAVFSSLTVGVCVLPCVERSCVAHPFLQRSAGELGAAVPSKCPKNHRLKTFGGPTGP